MLFYRNVLLKMDEFNVCGCLFCYISSAYHCPPVPYMHHARVYRNMTDASAVRVECNHGFRFPDGNTGVLLSCVNGTWEGTDDFCSGEIP